jgi:hypothetical protein
MNVTVTLKTDTTHPHLIFVGAWKLHITPEGRLSVQDEAGDFVETYEPGEWGDVVAEEEPINTTVMLPPELTPPWMMN